MFKLFLSAILLFISSNVFSQQGASSYSENQTVLYSEKKMTNAKQTDAETALIVQKKASIPELKKIDKKNVPRTKAETPELKKYSTTSVKRTNSKPVLLVNKKRQKKDKN